MSDFGNYHNNPLWNDITRLDHLSPQPEFSYSFNPTSGRWEPDLSNLYLYGISGLIVTTNWWLSGVSGEIHDFRLDTNERLDHNNWLLTGISGEIHDFRLDTNERLDHNNWLLTGISGEINQSAWENNIRLDGISGLVVNSNTWLQSISGEIDESNLWLKGISGVLSNEIKIGVDLDHDTETHRLLSGMSGVLDNIEIGVDLDADTESHRLLSGISGVIGDGDTETHRFLSGISGELTDLYISDTETHRLLSGVSGELTDLYISDTETHRLLSGVSGELANLEVSIGDTQVSIKRTDAQPWKLVTHTVNQKIEEEFILLECPDSIRYGIYSGDCYGTDKDIMDDIYETYHTNSRRDASTPETGHPTYFLHPEDIDTGRCIQAKYTFHTDTQYAFRKESLASSINAHPLNDYTGLYKLGLVDHVTIYNDSPYPLQIHSSKSNTDTVHLDTDMGVKINTDEAKKIHVKRPHTISGYTVNYSVTYKATGLTDLI